MRNVVPDDAVDDQSDHRSTGRLHREQARRTPAKHRHSVAPNHGAAIVSRTVYLSSKKCRAVPQLRPGSLVHLCLGVIVQLPAQDRPESVGRGARRWLRGTEYSNVLIDLSLECFRLNESVDPHRAKEVPRCPCRHCGSGFRFPAEEQTVGRMAPNSPRSRRNSTYRP